MVLGLAGRHGARALSRAAVEHRTDQEHAPTQAHSMVVPIVPIARQADKHATPTIVQVSSQNCYVREMVVAVRKTCMP